MKHWIFYILLFISTSVLAVDRVDRFDQIEGLNQVVKNGLAHKNTVGWSTYKDAAQSTIEDATGGSPSITWTRSTSVSRIEGDGSFLFTKGASNLQGEGVSYSATLPQSYYKSGERITVSFDVKLNSGAYVSGAADTQYDSDLGFQIYDVSNTATIPVDGGDIECNDTGVCKHVFTFPVQSDTEFLLLAFHQQLDGTSAYSMFIDNIVVSRATSNVGPPMVYLGELTTTGTWSANTTYTGKYWRNGDKLMARVLIELSGAPTSATLNVNLPSGLLIDTAKTSVTTGDEDYFGQGKGWGAAGIKRNFYVAYTSTSAVLIQSQGSSSVEIANVNATAPGTWASGDALYLNYEVPIVGWDSNVVMSNIDSGRAVSFQIGGGTVQAIGATTVTQLTTTWDASAETDSHGAWDSTNDRYVVAIPGTYFFYSRTVASSLAGGDIQRTWLYKNGSAIAESRMQQSGTVVFNRVEYLGEFAAGDYIDVRTESSSDGSYNVGGNSAQQVFGGFNWGGGSSIIALSETATYGPEGSRPKIASAKVNCDASSSILSQNGTWLSAIGNRSTTSCSITITTGVFSAEPTCVFTVEAATVQATSVNMTSATAGTIYGPSGDYDGNLICMGTR